MNNKDYETGQEIKVKFKGWGVISCEVISLIRGGYTKLLIRDIQSNKPSSSREGWSRNSNLGFGDEHIIHINQINA